MHVCIAVTLYNPILPSCALHGGAMLRLQVVFFPLACSHYALALAKTCLFCYSMMIIIAEQ